MKLTFSKSICITTVPRVGRASNCFYAMFSNRLLVMVTNTFWIFTSSYDAKEFSTFDAHHFQRCMSSSPNGPKSLNVTSRSEQSINQINRGGKFLNKLWGCVEGRV